MNASLRLLSFTVFAMLLASQADARENTFGEDVTFLSEHTEAVVLGDGDARVVVVPAYQGRVMTSTAEGDSGTSFGWINYDHIRAGKLTPQVNPYGGEERLWFGPDGGQFSFFFKNGSDFSPADWQVPAAIDSEPYTVVDQGEKRIAVRHRSRMTNYSRTTFEFQIDREITLLSRNDAIRSLGADLNEAKVVGYRSHNRLTNTGDNAWTTDTGAPSLWLLGMFKPSPYAKVIIPYREGDAAALGPVVNDLYLGKVPAERLSYADGAIFFSGDGRLRSKIGVSPARSLGVCGSYDSRSGVLTIIKYTPPTDPSPAYVNSMLEIQDRPFVGDAIHSYNDNAGPNGEATFYELETSSPALMLRPSESGEHRQETYHFQGPPEALGRITERVLGVTLEEIEKSVTADESP